jgi:hypothetical protein
MPVGKLRKINDRAIQAASSTRQIQPPVNHAASLAGEKWRCGIEGERGHSMKVSGTGGVSQASGAKPARGGAGGGFSISGPGAPAAPAAPAGVGGVGGVVGVEALLALQVVESSTERKRRSVGRAGRLLDELEGLKIALLGGELSQAQLDRLGRAVREQRAATDDPKLEGLLDEIETRAAVELAKLEAARAA